MWCKLLHIYIALKLFLTDGCQIKMIQFVRNLIESVFHYMHYVVLICENFHLLNTLLLYFLKTLSRKWVSCYKTEN